LGYEVLAGNTLDHQTLAGALASIEKQYGKARRVWVMDRGIPTEETLTRMRQSEPPVSYLVGTPKGRLSKLEAALAQRPWHEVRAGVTVKLLPQDGECYIFAQSAARIDKEPAPAQATVEALARVAPNEDPGPGWALDEAGRGAPAMAHGLALGSPARAQERGAD
jgi:hypothetical protein